MSRIFLAQVSSMEWFKEHVFPELYEAVSRGVRREGPHDDPQMVSEGKAPFEVTVRESSWVMRQTTLSTQSIMFVDDPKRGCNLRLQQIKDSLDGAFDNIFYVPLSKFDTLNVVKDINSRGGPGGIFITKDLSGSAMDSMNILAVIWLCKDTPSKGSWELTPIHKSSDRKPVAASNFLARARVLLEWTQIEPQPWIPLFDSRMRKVLIHNLRKSAPGLLETEEEQGRYHLLEPPSARMFPADATYTCVNCDVSISDGVNITPSGPRCLPCGAHETFSYDRYIQYPPKILKARLQTRREQLEGRRIKSLTSSELMSLSECRQYVPLNICLICYSFVDMEGVQHPRHIVEGEDAGRKIQEVGSIVPGFRPGHRLVLAVSENYSHVFLESVLRNNLLPSLDDAGFPLLRDEKGELCWEGVGLCFVSKKK